MNTHDIETVLRSYLTGDGYIAADDIPAICAAIEADRKRRGETVAWLYEDELPDNYPYEAMFPYSKVDGVRMFPVYVPQPAEPVSAPGEHHPLCDKAEPVKVPTAPDTIYLGCARMGMAGASDEEVLSYVRAATAKESAP